MPTIPLDKRSHVGTPPTEPGTLRRLAAHVRAGRTTSRELVERSLARIAQHADLNAVIALRADGALRDADELDRAIAAGGDTGPLAGLPLLGKDNDDMRGLPTTHGSLWFADAPHADSDGVSVGRLRAAGAIAVGKTNVPEFCIEGFTDNRLFGPTRNPWNRERSPGGSSGGSAAALSAGLTAIATATDGGGSSRIPAGLTGLLGLKPTTGVIGRRRAPEWIEFSTDGLMATSVDDLRLLLDCVVGPVAGDPSSAPGKLIPGSMPKRLIVADRTDELGPLPTPLADAFERGVAQLSELLALPVERREPGWFFPDFSPDEDWFTIAAAEHASMYGRQRIKRDLALLHPSAQEFLTNGLAVTADEYLGARRRRYAAVGRIDAILGGDAALVTPTLAVVGYSPDGRVGDGQPGLLGPEVYSTALQNVVNLPAISLPAGTIGGMPFGLQVTTPRWSDLVLLDIADLWESRHPWPRTAPGFLGFG